MSPLALTLSIFGIMLVLMAIRRVERTAVIPYGPFLMLGAVIATGSQPVRDDADRRPRHDATSWTTFAKRRKISRPRSSAPVMNRAASARTASCSMSNVGGMRRHTVVSPPTSCWGSRSGTTRSDGYTRSRI